MSNFCIVSEFNPFHNGHAYLVARAREMGADTVTCVMSGNSTQRGELALTDKYLIALERSMVLTNQEKGTINKLNDCNTEIIKVMHEALNHADDFDSFGLEEKLEKI